MIPFVALPPEFRLLLLAMRFPLSERDQSRCADLIGSGIDWPTFAGLVAHHRVQSVASAALDLLQKTQKTAIPQTVLDRLHAQARTNALRAVHSTGEAARVIRRFAESGFPLTLLKGVGLSQQIYANPGMRQVGDIDLLSTAGNLRAQFDLLGSLGYRCTVPEARLTPRRLASLVRFWKDATFHSPGNTFPIELHWRLFNHRFHPANRLLDVAEFTSEPVFGFPIRVLAPADQFLYQSAHGTADAWVYLKTLADVAGYLRILTAEQLDAALQKAASIGLLDHVSAAIHLANDWMGAEISSPRLSPAESALASFVRNRMESLLLRHDFKPSRSDPSPADWLRLELALVPGIRSKMEIVERTLNRPTLWNRIELPDGLFWLYPLAGALLPPRRHQVQSEHAARPAADQKR